MAIEVATHDAVACWAEVVWARALVGTEANFTALSNLGLSGLLLLKRSREELKSDFESEGGSVGAALALHNAINKLRQDSTAPAPGASCLSCWVSCKCLCCVLDTNCVHPQHRPSLRSLLSVEAHVSAAA